MVNRFSLAALATVVLLLAVPVREAGAAKRVLFGQPIGLAGTPTLSQTPSIADAGNGLIYVIWEEGGGRIGVARSTDGGKTFGSSRVFTPPEDGLQFSQMSAAASSDGVLHIATTAFDVFSGGAEILYYRSTDGGETLDGPVVVSLIDGVNSLVPRIVVNTAGHIEIAWQDTDLSGDTTGGIRYSRSRDGGATFTEPVPLDGHPFCPDLTTADADTTYVAWTALTDILFSRSSDGGLTFSPPVAVSRPGGQTWCPRIVRDLAGMTYILYLQGSAFRDRTLWLVRSADGGLSFEPPQRISQPGTDSACQGIAIDPGGTVFVTWGHQASAFVFPSFLAFSSDSGATFSPPADIMDRGACGDVIAPEAGAVGLAWGLFSDIGSTSEDLFWVRGVQVEGGPDLMITSVSTSTPAVVGASLTVSAVVSNTGNFTALPSTVALYLSSSPTIEPATARPIGSRSVPALGPGASSTVTTTVVIPADAAPGSYFVGACADSTGVVPETDVTNNCHRTESAIQVLPDLADLVVTAVSSPATATRGQAASVTTTIRNDGVTAAPSFSVGIYLAAAATIDPSTDRLVGQRTVTGLGVGMTSVETTSVTIPPNVASGTYFVGACADRTGAVIELDETTNCRAAPTTVQIGGAEPNLVVSAVAVTPSASLPGGSLTITHTVRNIALAPNTAPPTRSRLVLTWSGNSSVSAAVANLAMVAVPALTAGTGVTLTTRVTIPPGLAPGRYFVGVQANADGGIAETRLDDNERSSPTSVAFGPDLMVASASTGAGAGPGTSVNVTYTVRNLGGQAAAGFAIGFALVPTSDAGGAADVAVGPQRAGVTVAAGGAATLTNSVTIPADTPPGAYRIRIIADVTGVVAEVDETNNRFLAPTVVQVARADLALGSVTFTPGASRAGGRITVTQVVRNLSPPPGTAAASRSRLFLSSSNTSLAGALPLAEVPVGPIAGRGVASVTTAGDVPAATAPGLYYVLAQLDAENTVPEVQEGNVGASVGRLIVGPDLIVSTVSAARGAAVGANTSVTYTIRNVGGDRAGAFTIGFALVPVDSTGTPSGPEVQSPTRRSGFALAAGASGSLTDRVLVPAGTPAGLFKIRVIADVDTAVVEADEDNNSRLSGIVTIARVDLTVTAVTFAPAAAAAGANVIVTHTVKNLAPAHASAPVSSSAIFLSRNASFTGVFASLGEVAVPALGPGASAAVTRSVNLGAAGAGRYFFVVRANAAGGTTESDEGNNVGVSHAVIVGPDMAVVGATTVAGVAPGRTASVRYTLRNVGGAGAGPFDVELTLVPVDAGGTPSGPEVALSVVRRGLLLGPGLTLSLSDGASVPADLAPGRYRIIVRVTGLPADADPTNDRAQTSGVLSVVRADLMVASVSTTAASVAVDGNVGVVHTVRNGAPAFGDAPPSASSFHVATARSASAIVASSSVLAPVPSIAAGVISAPIAAILPLGPLGLRPGTYFVGVRADATSAVVESDETNNLGFSATPVVIGPDITVTSAAIAAGPGLGTTVSVRYALANRGGGAAGPFSVAFALVPDSNGGPPGTDLAVASGRSGVILGAGATSTFTDSLAIPATAGPGRYRIRVVADSTTAVLEADESNNETLTSVITVTRPDLVVSDLTLPSFGIAGRTVSVLTAVQNSGPAPAGAFEIGVYFSPDPVIDPGVDALAATRPVAGLAAGATSAGATSVVLPGAPRAYVVGAVVDRLGQVSEADESNNTRLISIGVVPEMLRGPMEAFMNVRFSGCEQAAHDGTFSSSTSHFVIEQHTPAEPRRWLGGATFGGRLNGAEGFQSLQFSGSVTPTGALGGEVRIAGGLFGEFVRSGLLTITGGQASSAGADPGTFQATFSGELSENERCLVSGTVEAPPPPRIIQFSTLTYPVMERAGVGFITVVREGDLANPTTVDYVVQPGTANLHLDYDAVNGRLTFAAGATSATFTVRLNDDLIPDGEETVLLTLTNPGAGFRLGDRAAAVLTIVSDDIGPGPAVRYPLAGEGRVVIADVDGDGLRDVVVAVSDHAPQSIFIYYQDASGGLRAPVVIELSNFSLTTIAVGDVNGDGRADIVAAGGLPGSGGGRLLVFRQDNTGHFGAPETLVIPPSVTGLNDIVAGVAIGDLNGDGRSDIVARPFGSVAVFYQQADGTLAPPVSRSVPSSPFVGGIVIADMDHDGRNDLVYKTGDREITILKQLASGELSPTAETYPVQLNLQTSQTFFTFNVGDLNGDGRNDLVVAGFGNNGVLNIYSQRPDGRLDAPVLISPLFNTMNAVAIGDMNGDGLNDVVLLTSLTVEILYQLPDHSFAPPLSSVIPTTVFGFTFDGALAVGDATGDGRPDVVVAWHDGLIVFPGAAEPTTALAAPVMLRE